MVIMKRIVVMWTLYQTVVVKREAYFICVAQNQKLEFTSEGFISCTDATPSVLRPSNLVRKQSSVLPVSLCFTTGHELRNNGTKNETADTSTPLQGGWTQPKKEGDEF